MLFFCIFDSGRQPVRCVAYIPTIPGFSQTIEAYLATSERHRVCWPQTKPWPLPVQSTLRTDDASSSSLTHAELVLAILHILDEYNIPGGVHVVPTRQWRYDESKRNVLTVFLTAEETAEDWLHAAKKIHHLLRISGQSDVLVELVNQDRVNFKTIVSESLSESDRNHFRSIRDPIYDILIRELKAAFLSVGLFMCKEGSDTPAIPCVFVFVQPSSTLDWAGVTTHVTDILAGRFGLQYRPGRMEYLVSQPGDGLRPDGLPLPGQFESSIHTGASISASEDQQGSGTLGIFIDLEIDEASINTAYGLSAGINKCVVTCHHNIQPNLTRSDFQEALDHGFPLQSNPYTNMDVVYPAHDKLKTAITALEKDLTADKMDLQNLRKQQEPDSKTNSSTAPEIKYHEALIQTNQKKLDFCRRLQASNRIGRVLFSSGVQVANPSGCGTIDRRGPCANHDHHLKDFAVIKLSTDTSCSNKAPVSRNIGWRLEEVTGTARPSPGMRVFKYGSQSGITAGEIMDEVYLPRPRIDMQGLFKAWSIVGDAMLPFGVRGDSGSGITNESKALVGQLHTTFMDQRGSSVIYMTSIQHIFDDIKAMIPRSRVGISPYNPPIFESWMGRAHNMLSALYEKLG